MSTVGKYTDGRRDDVRIPFSVLNKAKFCSLWLGRFFKNSLIDWRINEKYTFFNSKLMKWRKKWGRNASQFHLAKSILELWFNFESSFRQMRKLKGKLKLKFISFGCLLTISIFDILIDVWMIKICEDTSFLSLIVFYFFVKMDFFSFSLTLQISILDPSDDVIYFEMWSEFSILKNFFVQKS